MRCISYATFYFHVCLSYARMPVICTACTHVACLSYAPMPVICTYACQMHVCLTYARMLAKSTYSCHMYVLRMRTICTYAWRTSVCLTCARIPDICTHACQGLQRFRCSSGQTFQDFSKIFLMKPIKYWFYHFFGQYLRIFSVELKPLIFSPAVTGKTILQVLVSIKTTKIAKQF